MSAFFENLIKPFPPAEPVRPPDSLFAFCRHYTRGIEPYLVIMSVLTALIAVMEISLFAFLGRLVDWLSISDPSTFIDTHRDELVRWAVLILVLLPTAIALHALIVHQTLLGNYPMRIRWQAHRYLLGQSMSFYQDEFAGRISTKLMQTSLAVREAVLKLLDVLLYVTVYFGGLLVMIASANIKLTIPLFVWLGLYICILSYFIPKLGRVSMRQADARSDMTGRIVDSYTNISTVKLFSHSQRESDYAQQGMGKFLDTVHEQMRLVTALIVSVWSINVVMVFSSITMPILTAGF